jgi:MFS family permease
MSVNASFLLLAGRMGDLLGHRRVFLAGLAVFTFASLACGLASSPEFLLAGRAVQGLGGAVVSVVALSLIMTMFTDPAERAKAMSVIGFVITGGGSIGVFLGGVLTSVLSWHWIFLVNIPIGVAVITLCPMLLPASAGQAGAGRIDVASAVTVTAALMIAVYAITNGNHAGWTSTSTISLLTLAAALLAVFVHIQAHSTAPLMPLGLFRLRSVAAANVITVLWASAIFAGFFLSALYLRLVLGYRPLEVGLAFLSANLIMGAFSIGLSEKLVLRYGTRAPMAIGLLLVAAGLGGVAREMCWERSWRGEGP